MISTGSGLLDCFQRKPSFPYISENTEDITKLILATVNDLIRAHFQRNTSLTNKRPFFAFKN